MAREIKKTNPIGVRFDKDLLEGLTLASVINSPQKALNLYEKSYLELVELKIKNINSLNKEETVFKESKVINNEKKEITKLSMRDRIALEKLNFKK